MAKRLHMTGADYVAIAISPALIMMLVGSLVYFLIEVFYAGEYHARLNYVFALFVFAAVLIARISIEIGSERAAAFGLALGIATFLVLQKFVEHPSMLSPLINLGLIAIVWWCAHQLTWDCTLIDDNEDSSGQGLLQRIGVDEPEAKHAIEPTSASLGNELTSEAIENKLRSPRWWDRFTESRKGPHTPGVWVLYFSLAALPLFGIGQHWIPAAEVGRRRYAFGLLTVYVFSALSLLVTTSFLGLRRYLRQRHLEMPGTMAGTWVTIGAVLIVIVMFVAALLPRPAAEVAISQVPWQARSPEGLSPSRYGQGADGVQESERPGDVVSEDTNAPRGDAVRKRESPQGQADGSEARSGEERSDGQSGEPTNNEGAGDRASSDQKPGESGPTESEAIDGEASQSSKGAETGRSSTTEFPGEDNPAGTEQGRGRGEVERDASGEKEQDSASRFRPKMLEHEAPDLSRVTGQMVSSLGGIAGFLKLLFYLVVAILFIYFVWRNRARIAQAIADIARRIRAIVAALFGGGDTSAQTSPFADAGRLEKRRTFAEFRDPFSSGMHRQAAPDELVRYTFAAFEAWAGDRGMPRSVDQTPQELVRATVAPRTLLHTAARRMVGIYSALAYAGANVSQADVESLRELWRLMAAERERG